MGDVLNLPQETEWTPAGVAAGLAKDAKRRRGLTDGQTEELQALLHEVFTHASPPLGWVVDDWPEGQEQHARDLQTAYKDVRAEWWEVYKTLVNQIILERIAAMEARPKPGPRAV